MGNKKTINMTQREVEDSVDTMSMLHDKQVLIRNNMGFFERTKKKKADNSILLLRSLLIVLVDAEKNNKTEITFDETMLDVFELSIDTMLELINTGAWMFKNNDAKNALINLKNVLIS